MRGIIKIMIASALLFVGAVAFAQQDNRQVLQMEDGIGVESNEFPDFDPEIAAENGFDVVSDEIGNYTIKSTASSVMESIAQLLKRFAFNLLICWIIVQFFYYRKSKRRDYYFTLIIFSSAMFLLLFVMNNLSLQIGFTLGLFAIFGMIRYRTESVPIREMTYLFIIIALSVINGVGAEIPFAELLVANIAVILLIWALEAENGLLKHTSTKLVIYDRIDLIVPEKRQELIEDLEKRTGLKIDSIEIGQVDFLKDSAWIKVNYTLGKGERNTIDSLTRTKDFQEH